MLHRWQEDLGSLTGGEPGEDWEMDPATAARLQALGYIE
jgi:hypothetical protein